MSKLLYAEFIRLFHSIVFKLCLLFSSGLAIFAVIMRWRDIKQNPELYAQYGAAYTSADGLIFVGIMYLVFAFAVFMGIFVGTEYSDGTIRNKLMVGHTRSSIYFSKLIVCVTANVASHLLFILVVLLFGNLLLDDTTMTARQLLAFTAVDTVGIIAITAIFLLLSLSIQSKATGSIVLLLTIMIMFVATLTINAMLDAPEYYEAYSFVDEDTGETISVPREKNHSYLTGTKRNVYEFLNNFLPTSQMYQTTMNIEDNLKVMPLYDCAIILVSTGVGLVIFEKKNLK